MQHLRRHSGLQRGRERGPAGGRDPCSAGRAVRPFEIIFVDDGSTDGTAAAVRRAREAGIPEIRLLQHSRRCGQSAAVCTGVRAARAEWVATLDGDGQNDPADIPALLRALLDSGRSDGLKLVMGNRVTRKDTWLRRLSRGSPMACAAALAAMARPTPAAASSSCIARPSSSCRASITCIASCRRLFQRAGARVISVPVRHRPRTRGVSKYGVRNRLWVGIVDLFGVRWLIRRNPPRVQRRRSDEHHRALAAARSRRGARCARRSRAGSSDLASSLIATGIGLRDPWPADEPRFALIARDMVATRPVADPAGGRRSLCGQTAAVLLDRRRRSTG